MRSAKDFLKPLAIGAPLPVREIPFRPSRMIHFFDPSNRKMVSKVPDLAKRCDVLLGNLEDAIAADKKVEARRGLIQITRETNFGAAQLWTRVNSLDSPWVLDDLIELVSEIGQIGSVVTWALLSEQEDGRVRVNLRSKGTVDVAAIAATFGGGGHARAAGARMSGSMEDAKAQIVRELTVALGADTGP